MKLKTKLIALNFCMLFFVGTMLFLQFRAAQNKQRFEIRKTFSQSSEKLEKAISNVFYLYYHNVQNFALNTTLQSKKFEDANFYFNELVSLYPLYDLIVFVDTDGNFISSNSLDRSGNKLDLDKVKGFDFKIEPWFKALKNDKLVEDFDKKIYGSFFGEYVKSELVSGAFNSDKFGNHFSAKVNDEFGDTVGYITTFLSSRWINSELLALNKSLKNEGKDGAEIFLLNNDGQIISEISDSKLVEDKVLNENFEKKLEDVITDSKKLVEPSFVSSMFMVNDSDLTAFKEFTYEKFVSSVGWKTLIRVGSSEAFSSISVASNIFSISFFLTLILASIISMLVSNKLSNQLLKIASNISDESSTITKASGELSGHSASLSSATSEQASSLQQTVASLNEISAMINKNTDASQGSKDLSIKSRKAAEVGKGTIIKMIESIDDISDANSEIINQMKQNTDEIQGIITVIKEIEDKTKVINDIVFQTKLLSFNASVEAARAGEHGKGFSVVAEEVGNLAQHSGDAAKQIEEMLNESVTKVESIASKTSSKVKTLIDEGTSKVEKGKSVAKECDSALGEILEHANNLDSMIDEIAVASIEQSQGVQEINKAMSELDTVTKQNSLIAQETSSNTQGLNKQAVNLNEISKLLTGLITGQKNIAKVQSKSIKTKEVKVELDEPKKSKKVHLEVVQSDDNSSSNSNTQPKLKSSGQVEVKEEKKLASSDLSVPQSSDGDWEDI